jgi:putative ABC transport system permease protein
MTLFLLAWDRIRGRPVPALLTALAVALSVGLVVITFGVRRGLERSLVEAGGFCDLIIGPKGGALETFLGVGPGIIPVAGRIDPDIMEDLRADYRIANVAPVAMEDDYRGWRIVGTTKEHPFFAPLDVLNNHLQTGARVAIVGADAAKALRIGIGDTFVTTHNALRPESPFEVVEVLRPRASWIDRSIFVPLAAASHAHHHADHRCPETGPCGHVTISALLVTLKTPLDLLPIQRELADLDGVTVVDPRAESAKIRVFLADAEEWLWLAAAAIVALAALSIGAAMAAHAEERRREAAILRAIGASSGTIVAVEAIGAFIVSGCGALFGLAGAGVLLGVVGPGWTPHGEEIHLVLLTILFGLVVSLAVSLQLYRIDLDDALRPRP